MVVVGLQATFGEGFGSGDPGGYLLTWGVSAALALLAAVLLARPGLRVEGWPGHLSRATMLVAGVAFVGAVLAAVGGLLQGNAYL